ncbi:diaminopropionate ammonia-lyase [Elioraea tepida]|uniref:Diaminopropionate ammonia-lyase n=1 Tax=Elioraea tepida TaxID=2843330 RepID=A0A975U3E3_9PROT|nr:diaminopropionate ammonia-lyase [Elioraea tepida]QXM25637.1 diaminopropionate ammonia-lyase [Elioraea tepida]
MPKPLLPPAPFRLHHNVLRGRAGAPVLDQAGREAASAEIRSWPDYAPTPLVPLPGLASRIGVAAIGYKDEAGRFGLGSFKALGGAYAVARHLLRRLAGSGIAATSADLASGRFADRTRAITVTCATDGNHGRSVAWGAQRFGCRAVIYIHETVSEGRAAAIARFGAEVRRVPGTYDDAVRRAAEDAAREDWTVVSDTSYPGYTEIPCDVMDGYRVMAAEALGQWRAAFPGAPPTHVFAPGGVGGVAAAIAAELAHAFGEGGMPRLVVVEPDRADCLRRSAEAGRPVAVEGELDTVMAGLACGEVSLLAFDELLWRAHAFMAVPDEVVAPCMRLLADGVGGDPKLVAGESAVAGLAALLLARSDADAASSLRLGESSRVLLFGTEGATDPELYARLVGRSAESVRAG